MTFYGYIIWIQGNEQIKCCYIEKMHETTQCILKLLKIHLIRRWLLVVQAYINTHMCPNILSCILQICSNIWLPSKTGTDLRFDTSLSKMWQFNIYIYIAQKRQNQDKHKPKVFTPGTDVIRELPTLKVIEECWWIGDKVQSKEFCLIWIQF